MKKINFVIIAIIICVFFIGYLNFRQDDAYIFYTYARNIADGHGYVFNPGEKVNATTSPLYTILLAIAYFIIKPLFPDSLVYIGSVISTGSIALILFLMRKIINDDDKFLFFALIFFSIPLLKFGFGMETYLNLALIVLTTYLFTQNKIILTSVFAGLTVLARLDSVLFVGVLFIYYTITYKKIPPISSIILFMLVVAPWFIFSKAYFNSFLPTTIGVKLSQHEFAMHGTGLIFLKGFTHSFPGTIVSFIFISSGLISSLAVLLKRRINLFKNDGLKLIFIWSIALFLVYAFILNAPPYQWYYTPFTLPIAVVLTYASQSVFVSGLKKRSVLFILFLTACFLPIKNIVSGFNPKYSNYLNASKWLNKNAPHHSILGVDEIGILGYYYQRGKLVDALGLITPEISSHLSKKEFTWYLEKYSPDFIVNDYPYAQKHAGGNEKVFHQNYVWIKVFESKGEKIAIYKRKAPQNL